LGIQAIKISRIAAATALFTVLLLAIYIIHSLYFKVNVVFYSAIIDAFLATALCGVLLYALPWFRVLGPIEKFQLLAIWLLLGYGYAISVPTVLDRSLSFYILEKLDQRGGGIREEAFEDIFTKEYVKEHHLVEVRLTEQIESGTVLINNGCVMLTDKGRRLAHLSRLFRNTLLPKHRLLMGKYSDALTDPFRNSTNDVNYKCQ